MRAFRHVNVARQFLSTVGRSLHTENDIYKAGSGTPSIIGSVVTALFEGKGRGVIARHNVNSGDLLLCARPAVIIQGQPEAQPDVSLMVPALVQAANAVDVPEIAGALQYLYDGTDASRQLLPDMHKMMEKPAAVAADGSSSSGGGCDHSHPHHHDHSHHHHSHDSSCQHEHHHSHNQSHSNSHKHTEQRVSEQQAGLLVKYNAFGDDYEDLAAAAVRGAAVPHSHVGLWPQFALFNHSCLPNTVHYVVGHAMVVRAVEDVAAGEELTVSYLGREEFAPAGARHAVLSERYGFSCDCQRCSLEARAPQQLQQQVEQIYATVMKELKPQFMEAVEHQDHSMLAHVQTALQQLEDALSNQLQQHMPSLSNSAVLVLQAAVYDLYELLLFCEHLVGKGNASEKTHSILARLGRCIAILNCVSKGAELHVYLASRMLQHAVNLRGADSVQAEAAAALLVEAHRLRYGSRIDEELQMQLMEANKQVAEEFLM